MTADVKSCFGCPSLVKTASIQQQYFRVAFGVPVCVRYGKLMGPMNSTPEDQRNVAMSIAANCNNHGQPMPSVVEWSDVKFELYFPDMQAAKNPGGTSYTDPDLVESCAGCRWRVDRKAMEKETGIDVDLCSAKGKFIPSHRHRLEARNCTMKAFGSVRRDPYNLTFLPEYAHGFVAKQNPKSQMIKKLKQPQVDPQEYETDAEVTPEHSASGIRAWRQVVDGVTMKSVLLPIYDRAFFSEGEQEKIPKTGDDEHPEDHVDYGGYVYKTAVLWRHLDETPALWGKSGLGKTEHFRHMAWLMGLPFERFSITASTELDDLAGKMHYIEGTGTKFEYGRLPKAWMKPNVIVVDEPNTGPPDVWQFLRPLTDNSKQLVLDMNSGERIVRHDDAYLGMAMNPAWDMLNVGAQVIGDADANRLMHIQFELPPEKLERQIIAKRCSHDGWTIPPEDLKTVMNIAKDIRNLADQGTVPITWGVRPQIKVARALQWFDWLTAYKMAAADYLEPRQQEQILDAVRAHVTS